MTRWAKGLGSNSFTENSVRNEAGTRPLATKAVALTSWRDVDGRRAVGGVGRVVGAGRAVVAGEGRYLGQPELAEPATSWVRFVSGWDSGGWRLTTTHHTLVVAFPAF